jgi:hypothetical protein
MQSTPQITIRLTKELERIEALVMQLLDLRRIMHFSANPKSDCVVVPIFFWDQPDATRRAFQTRLLARYSEWFRQFSTLEDFRQYTVESSVIEADQFIRRWIAQQGCWDVQITVSQCRAYFSEHLTGFRQILKTVNDLEVAELEE